ncbi:hypothetical protein HMPREF6485_2515 [Segatella buccae ATCC 33574]|uniref:ATPase AAA-type core domain-containing protein n=2 Tax=Segatella buccae TaxID=28126 RepID=E6KA79_9BACT|nr:hypothetical protein HMPREF6485_2515 [Segatella buccae ATCC 33574]
MYICNQIKKRIIMIQEFKIKNFLSFKDEVRFSFEASNDTFAETSQVVKINKNTRLLRFAVVYGYNASGKSNLLKAFEFLVGFWFKKQNDPYKSIRINPFKLNQSSKNEHSFFELVFYVNGVKYWYQLELDQSMIFFEKLSYYNYKSTEPVRLFERKIESGQTVISFGDLEVNEVVKDNITILCLNNMSFFAAREQVNTQIPLIDAAKEWMREKFMDIITPSTNLTAYAQRKSSDDEDLKKYIINFLREADFNISNINTDVVNSGIPEGLLDMLLKMRDLPAEEKERIRNEKTFKQLRTEFFHTVENNKGAETYPLSLDDEEESDGTVRTFGIEAAIYSALNKNSFLAIDEIENSLHPKLLEKILFEFLKQKSQSQLLVTTHNDGLLDLVDDLIRKDSIWFTEKQKSGITELYKLSDFRALNHLSSIREAYRNKRFGATKGS